MYERCLIACANYPEYWIRYILCMETSGSVDLANNALARATQVFVKVGSFLWYLDPAVNFKCLETYYINSSLKMSIVECHFLFSTWFIEREKNSRKINEMSRCEYKTLSMWCKLQMDIEMYLLLHRF